MLDAAGTLSINRFTGDGSRTSWDINFAGGYMQQADVKAYTTVGAVNTIQVVAWVGPNTVSIVPAVAVGVQLTIYRDTPKTAPVVDFTDGAIVNEVNLDKLAKQAVFTAAEMVDRFAVVNDKADAGIIVSNLAYQTSLTAIANASLIVGGDYTKFGRTDVAGTWTAAQNFTGGLTIGGATVATQAFVTAAVGAISFAAYTTTTAQATLTATAKAEAIAAAAADATTKDNAVTTAAATDATNKDNALLALIDPDWLYTLASR
jgi:hypothetical protein